MHTTASRLTLTLCLTALGLVLALLAVFSLDDEGVSLRAIAQRDVAPLPSVRGGSPASLAATITVSGTVTGPSGAPVADVFVGVGSPQPQDWQEATTDAGGFYSVTIQTDGQLWFNVLPQLSDRLTQVNMGIDGVTADFTQNFTLTAGYLLDVRLTDSGGVTITEGVGMEIQALMEQWPEDQWYQLGWHGDDQRYRAVLPPDVYYVTAKDPPVGYYETAQTFDLRAADLITDMQLSTVYVHPIPYDPPDATKITIGPVDDVGEAVVTGTAGAALPLAHVFLVNLNSSHQAHAISEADGSFAARIYAPPGSAIMIKHGPPSLRWGALDVGISEGINPFPGTIINVPHTHAGDQYELPFAAAGAIDHLIDDANDTRNYVGSAWAMTGTVGPIIVGEWTRMLTGTYDGSVVPGLYLGGLNWTHPALGDLDADGDLELLVGEQFGHLVLYRNEGDSTSPDWQFETAEYAGVDTGGWVYPALADVTNDGVLDLFVGAGNGTVSIYYNDGTSAAPVWPDEPDVSLSAGDTAAPALDDLDGDGLLDLLVGYFVEAEGVGKLYHFRNIGTLTTPTWTGQTDSYAAITETTGLQPAFVNLDGDTDRDMLVGLCGQMVWYERDGTPPTWTRHASDPIGYGFGSCGTSPGIGNWDGDSDDDVVTGEHWGNLRFFRNDGPPTWTELGFSFPIDLAGDTAPALADWDDNSTLDLLLGQAWGEVHPYTNTGTTTSPAWQPDGVLTTIDGPNHPHAFPTFADIDGDDDYDLFVGEGGWQGPGAGGNIHQYENTGTNTSPTWTLVVTDFLGIDVGGWSTPVFVDIDDDDDLDLFVGDEAGMITFVENTGTITTPTWAGPVHPYAGLELGAYSAPAFLDVDQDNDLDMLVGLESGTLAYVRNTGAVDSPAWELVSTVHPDIDVGGHATPAAADIDGDGDRDLLIGDGDGGLNVYLYEGPGAPPSTGNVYAPGDWSLVRATVRLYSPAITATTNVTDITVNGGLHLMMLYDQDGRPLPAENYFMSSMLTPSGFPIQRSELASVWAGGSFFIEDLQYLGGHTVEGRFRTTAQIPSDVPAGIYRPFFWLGFTSVPTSTDWLAANVVYHTFWPDAAPLPPIQVGQIDDSSSKHLVWWLLMDDFVQGTRGTGAWEDRDIFGLASQIVSQGAPYYIPPVDVRTGQPITYRLEPFVPMISYTDRRMPTPPLLPFDLPGGQLHVVIQEPDGTVRDLGSEAFAQSFNRTKTTRGGGDLNSGTVQLEDAYSLKAASDRFRVTFDQYGHHVITMTGVISDIWGNGYDGGGAYDVWVAQPLDIDPGVLPGTPLAVGDAFNPAMQFYPRVPAEVSLVVTLYPDSDPAQMIAHTVSGRANLYGYFSTNQPITLTVPGEVRVDLTALYTDTDGTLYMGTMTWGGVVMTPEDDDPDLVAHGRRGLDSLTYIPDRWFVSCRDLDIQAGAVSHTLNPYYNGDMVWSRMQDAPDECEPGISSGGDSLILGASVDDTLGTVEAAIETRAARVNPELSPPGDFGERVDNNELPLFISTLSGLPPQFVLGKIGQNVPGDVDQIAYSYRSSQRPGVRVREVVAEDSQSGGYWRLDTLYDDQLGVGVLGDQPNDFKFQYVGAVYRDLETGHSEYAGQGSGWIFIPDDDARGSRVKPPFAGYGAWDSEGGPILTLKGEDVHIFILPTGTRPGAVLQMGDVFRFAGHIMPMLDSRVAFTVTAPGGTQYLGGGQANAIGYFYHPGDDLAVDEPGLWSVDVRVWHDSACSGGTTSEPYPSGDVLGSDEGRYWFYVVSPLAPRLDVSSPPTGFLSFDGIVTPISITGSLPAGLSGTTVDYTISMPGYILQHGQATIDGGTYEIVFDPQALYEDFPNLDLQGRDGMGGAGLSDTFAIGLLLRGESGGNTVYRANTITIQGEQVFIGDAVFDALEVYLPLVLRNSP
jgi:hypothetical protein